MLEWWRGSGLDSGQDGRYEGGHEEGRLHGSWGGMIFSGRSAVSRERKEIREEEDGSLIYCIIMSSTAAVLDGDETMVYFPSFALGTSNRLVRRLTW